MNENTFKFWLLIHSRIAYVDPVSSLFPVSNLFLWGRRVTQNNRGNRNYCSCSERDTIYGHTSYVLPSTPTRHHQSTESPHSADGASLSPLLHERKTSVISDSSLPTHIQSADIPIYSLFKMLIKSISFHCHIVFLTETYNACYFIAFAGHSLLGFQLLLFSPEKQTPSASVWLDRARLACLNWILAFNQAVPSSVLQLGQVFCAKWEVRSLTKMRGAVLMVASRHWAM